jgi:hypothetical protein
MKYNFDIDHQYFNSNQRALLISHYRKYIIIHNGEFVNGFNDLEEALNYGKSKFKLGNFTLKKVTDNEFNPIKLHNVGIFV